MKNTAITAAIATITRVVDAMERETAAGSPTWEQRYYQEQKDHASNVNAMHSATNALKVELEAGREQLTARTAALTGYQHMSCIRALKRCSHECAMEGTLVTVKKMADERDEAVRANAAYKQSCAGYAKEIEDYKKTDAILREESAIRREQLGIQTKEVSRLCTEHAELQEQLADLRKLVVSQRAVIKDLS